LMRVHVTNSFDRVVAASPGLVSSFGGSQGEIKPKLREIISTSI